MARRWVSPSGSSTASSVDSGIRQQLLAYLASLFACPRTLRLPQLFWVLTVGLLLLACAGTPSAPASRSSQESASGENQQAGPRGTLRLAWPREPDSLASKFTGGGGAGEYAWIFNSTLAFYDFGGVPHPLLARELPTVENGAWTVAPDGTMTTTFRLHERARWHDGTPLTAADFAFAHEVYLDRDVTVDNRLPETLIAAVEAPDELTLVIHWSEPYPRANVLSYQELNPLPRHLVEQKYRTNKASFATGDEWTYAFIGTGPFRLERWSPGSNMVARAFRDWVLGPPKIETVEIRFIAEASALVANLLAGETDVLSPGLRVQHAVSAREQWVATGKGSLKTWEARLVFLEFQHRDVPTWQRAVTDVRVRRALMHAFDRQGLVEVVNFGIGSTADAFVVPSDPAFPDVDRAITKYPYDPTRATTLLAEAGWRRTGEGGPIAGPGGQSLEVDVWANEEPEATIVAEAWGRVGIRSSPYYIPQARSRDAEHRVSFPGSAINRRTVAPQFFAFIADEVTNPARNWTGSNRGSFVDAEVDRLYGVLRSSLNPQDQRAANVALNTRLTELVGIGPLYYPAEVMLVANRVKGPIGNYGPQLGTTWNLYEWEVTD